MFKIILTSTSLETKCRPPSPSSVRSNSFAADVLVISHRLRDYAVRADSFARLENALRRAFHWRGNSQLAIALTSLWEIWSLHPELHHRALATRPTEFRYGCIVLHDLTHVLVGIGTWWQAARCSRSWCCACCVLSTTKLRRATSRYISWYPRHIWFLVARVELTLQSALLGLQHTLVRLLYSLVSGSILLLKFTQQLGAGASSIERVQQRFSEFTSGWKLCADLCQLLSCSLTVRYELVLDGYDIMAGADSLCTLPASDDGTCSVASVRTTYSITASKCSVAKPAARFESKRAHYQSAIARDVIQEDEDNPACERFKLKTLGEHRFATRFQEKRVTPTTWRSALREAHKLIQSGERVNLVDALYLLLEIIWLDPRGCNLASMYLDTGSIYLEFDHLTEAVKAYRNSVRLDPSNWKARYNLGIASARSQDFVEAIRQLKLALKTCPADIAVEIVSIFEEIDRIQCSKNLRAFNATKPARAFTNQYLESVHFAAGTCRKSEVSSALALQEDHTLSHRNGLPLGSNTPQLMDVSHEWQGPMASLLHRLYAFSRCRHTSVQEELRRLDPTRSGGLSLHALSEVAVRITGTPLRATELKALDFMLGNEGSIIFHFLTPNTDSVHVLDEMLSLGAYHALLELKLHRKRAQRSVTSRTGGLWRWFDITMAKWIEQVLPQLTSHKHAASALIESLSVHGWVTPMDFAWQWKRMPERFGQIIRFRRNRVPAEPDDLPVLKLADRGTFIYECHRARSCIQEEARCTLQMFARRTLIQIKRGKNTMLRGTRPVESKSKSRPEFHLSEDVYARLATETLLDQQIAREVLRCLDDMVDDLIMSSRQQQCSYEDAVAWQDIPVRSEQRQKVISAVSVVQTAVRTKDSA